MPAMKKAFLLFLFIFAQMGCAGDYWAAQFYVWQAENSFDQGYKMKEKKAPYEERVPYYQIACDYYLKAFSKNTGVFTFGKIEQALDSCWRAENQEGEEVFSAFAEEYAKEHPKEVEYGDPGPFGEIQA